MRAGKRWLLIVAGSSLWQLQGDSFEQQATKKGFKMITVAYGQSPAPSVCKMVSEWVGKERMEGDRKRGNEKITRK